MVALLDAADVEAPLKAWRFASQRLRGFTSALHQDRAIRFDRRVLAALTKAWEGQEPEHLSGRASPQETAGRGPDEAVPLLAGSGLAFAAGTSTDPGADGLSVRRAELPAEGPFDGELVLFRATRGEGMTSPMSSDTKIRCSAGASAPDGRVRAHDVPGGHSSMLQEPHVQVLADQMQLSIDEALADEPASPHDSAVTDSSRHASQSVPTIC